MTNSSEYVPFLNQEFALELDKIVLPAVQVYTAERLASAFYHEWGGYQIPSDVDGVKLGDIYRDTRRTHRVSEGWQTGISYPEVDGSGNVVHTTMTGRTGWSVAPSGYVTITIKRPEGVCLQAGLGGVYGGGELLVVRGDVPYGTRHLDALHKALSVIGKRWMVLYAIAPLWAEAEDYDRQETRHHHIEIKTANPIDPTHGHEFDDIEFDEFDESD